MSEDHDQRFKALLKQFFGEFFQLFLPEWAAKLDFTQIEWLDKEVFPDPPDGPRRTLDLLCKLPSRLVVRWGDQESDAWILLSECVEAYLPLETPAEEAEYERLIGTEAYEEVQQMATTTFEKGVQQGLEKGLEKGMERTARKLIIDVLQVRFRDVPPQVLQRIEQWPAGDLTDLHRRALTAATLSELGLA